ncbi:ATP-NAD kinase family protein [Oceanicoccus sp. KOV_DT_Chl]|uniref:ATP-NAD kinase family protein n=1 Tax=Oceanicoccus sp. KOV_DT_Chl TaxID=1904639 RepID=UPI000C7A74E1|nr:ATP-NAD kinase family protein [Oceanicoccus sp. KOV_DT_Chl]
MFNLGLVVNPLAGIGGPLALKGSDGDDIVAEAERRGAECRAMQRTAEALRMLVGQPLMVFCFADDMGETSAKMAGLNYQLVGQSEHLLKGRHSTAADTQHAVSRLLEEGVDIIVFAGGDGTARDVFQVLGSDFPVLGIPCGVKMHSAVYAISPQGAGEIMLRMLEGGLVDIGLAEVRDIDEQAFRQGVVRSRFYGELLVPREGQFLQQVKSSGREVEALVVQDIGADIVESMGADYLYLIGPGTTPQGIMEELGVPNTLLGFDAIKGGQVLGHDLDEKGLIALVERHPGKTKIIITAIGGQGHILGRGNQQLSPAVIRMVGLDNLIIVATKTKITGLSGRPLLVDSNDPELDEALSGYRTVITGYHDSIIYPVGYGAKAVPELVS